MAMKKYLIPDTDAFSVQLGVSICHAASDNGEGQQNPPGTPDGDPTGAPSFRRLI
ncbi:MAG: hypothetical protein IJ581_06945 [Paludibacteraceae bacterium]|nr:hypothetical protein [Paludibacteraceae bacterium]